jgi:hypothetical protein
MVLHHQSIFFLFPHLKFLVLELGLKVHTGMMVKPFLFKISYIYRAFHFSHTFYILFLHPLKLYPTLHPTKDLHPSLP